MSIEMRVGFLKRIQNRMLLSILTLLLLTGCQSTVPVKVQTENHGSVIVNELSSYQPQGYELIKKTRADMNGDGLDDWLMVYERFGMPDEERLFQILQTQLAGESVVFENNGLATCRNCGGTRTNDPLVSVSPIPNGFVVVTEGGSREAWSRTVTFKYFDVDKSWQLVEVSEKSIDSQTGEQSKSVVLRPPKDFGKINFQDKNFNLMSLFK